MRVRERGPGPGEGVGVVGEDGGVAVDPEAAVVGAKAKLLPPAARDRVALLTEEDDVGRLVPVEALGQAAYVLGAARQAIDLAGAVRRADGDVRLRPAA